MKIEDVETRLEQLSKEPTPYVLMTAQDVRHLLQAYQRYESLRGKLRVLYADAKILNEDFL